MASTAANKLPVLARRMDMTTAVGETLAAHPPVTVPPATNLVRQPSHAMPSSLIYAPAAQGGAPFSSVAGDNKAYCCGSQFDVSQAPSPSVLRDFIFTSV